MIETLLILQLLLCGSVEHTSTEGRIGIEVDYSSGLINYVHRKSPAKLAGLKRGDKVLTVDGLANYCNHIHGEPGSTVHLMILRGKRCIFFFDVVRTERWRIGVL